MIQVAKSRLVYHLFVEQNQLYKLQYINKTMSTLCVFLLYLLLTAAVMQFNNNIPWQESASTKPATSRSQHFLPHFFVVSDFGTGSKEKLPLLRTSLCIQANACVCFGRGAFGGHYMRYAGMYRISLLILPRSQSVRKILSLERSALTRQRTLPPLDPFHFVR